MICDFHTHTSFSGDSSTPPHLQIEQAITLGMKEICITDHHDFDVPSDEFLLDLEPYFTKLKALQELYHSKIRVNIGIELGLQSHIKDYLETFAQSAPFDFIIGSSHFIDGADPYFPEFFHGRSEKEAYTRYFESTLNRVKNLDCFDVFGHLDYVVRYGPTKNENYHYSDYQDYIDSILKTLIDNGKGLECNTGGYKYGLGHPNPCEEILIRYHELGGEILTIGSDAHTPDFIGYSFAQARDVLISCGFDYYTIFHNRKAEFIKL